MVPRLILQPVIENAFEHGLEKKRSNGLLNVSFEKDGDRLLMIVEDNGGQLDDLQVAALNRELEGNDGTVETTALLNIHQRIRMKFGPRSGMHLELGEGQGLRAILIIYPKDGGTAYVPHANRG
ncbi:Sensor histidine kinase YpdA [compost metagenome]